MLAQLGISRPMAMYELYSRVGSAAKIVNAREHIREICPDISDRFVKLLSTLEQFRKRAEEEMEYTEKHRIKVLCMPDPNYPQRLKNCPDAPMVLYSLGNADLNARHTVSIVGTRHCTAYGRELVQAFVRDLKNLCPDVIIFSGLAYGIDVSAHRAALDNGLSTVGIVAHGLDDIYPRTHRDTAAAMLKNGGLLTEYTTHTQPKAHNFVQRNRIVAGCTDATLLVESARKGGGLITCRIAQSYGRDVFAFPGAVGAEYSEGCNNLIHNNTAGLITSAEDFVKDMNWEISEESKKKPNQGIERTLFPDLSSDEQRVVDVLSKNNDLQINTLAIQSDTPIARLSAILFELEMKGVVQTMAGGTYHLLTL